MIEIETLSVFVYSDVVSSQGEVSLASNTDVVVDRELQSKALIETDRLM